MPYEGEVVRLRAIEPEDDERYVRWLNDPDVTRTLALRYPLGPAEEAHTLDRLSRAQSYENAVFAVELKATGEHIGSVGLHGASIENRWATLGIFVGVKAYWGRGYGADTLLTALRFAFWEMNLRLVRLEVLDTNPRARALYERTGFVHEGTKRADSRKRGEHVDHHVMSITREEFEARHGPPPDLRQEVLP